MFNRSAVRRVLLALGLLSVAANSGLLVADDNRDKERASTMAAVDVAEKWIVAVVSGDVETALSLSEVPFSWDRKMLVKTKEDLETLYKKVVADKGARDLTPTKVEVADEDQTKKLLESATFDKKPDVVAVIAYFGDEGVGILVTKGRNARVCAISD